MNYVGLPTKALKLGMAIHHEKRRLFIQSVYFKFTPISSIYTILSTNQLSLMVFKVAIIFHQLEEV